MVVVVVVVVMVVVVVSDHFAASWIQKVKSKISVCMLPTFLSIFVKFLLAEGEEWWATVAIEWLLVVSCCSAYRRRLL